MAWGSTEDRNGWSWTDDRQVAEQFAKSRALQLGHLCSVWVADVEPSALLARITEERPGEQEYVVDGREISVRPAD